MKIPKIYEVVKKAVWFILRRTRPGLMLGLVDLGGGGNAWIGGYHVVASNAIVMNRRPLDYIKEKHPELYRPYIFVILLHEYIHTLGYHDETETRAVTLHIAREIFGQHLITNLAQNISAYLPYLQQMQYGWQPSEDHSIYYLIGFDESSVGYII